METTFEDYGGNQKPKKRMDFSELDNANGSSFNSSVNIDRFVDEKLAKPAKSDFFGLNPLSKTYIGIQKKVLHLGFEAKAKEYNLMVETRMKLMKEKGEAGLLTYSAISRQAVASVVLSKMEELSSIVFENQKRFITKLEQHDEFAQGIKNESRRRRYQRQIEVEELRHFEFLDNVINKFQSIMDQKLSNYR